MKVSERRGGQTEWKIRGGRGVKGDKKGNRDQKVGMNRNIRREKSRAAREGGIHKDIRGGDTKEKRPEGNG